MDDLEQCRNELEKKVKWLIDKLDKSERTVTRALLGKLLVVVRINECFFWLVIEEIITFPLLIEWIVIAMITLK